jgi:hypothetical protein
VNGFGVEEIINIVKETVSDSPAMQIQVIDQYDLYYLDRRRERPLPVIRGLLNDEEKTRYYIDPQSGQVVSTFRVIPKPI